MKLIQVLHKFDITDFLYENINFLSICTNTTDQSILRVLFEKFHCFYR